MTRDLSGVLDTSQSYRICEISLAAQVGGVSAVSLHGHRLDASPNKLLIFSKAIPNSVHLAVVQALN